MAKVTETLTNYLKRSTFPDSLKYHLSFGLKEVLVTAEFKDASPF